MANALTFSQGGETHNQLDRILCRDRAIDSSYIEDGHGEEDYAKEPWKHYKNALRSYLSLRFSDQTQFLDRMIDADAEDRIKHEIRRVEKARKKFFAQTNKQALVNELIKTREQWKDKVIGEIGQIRRERQKQLGKSIKEKYREELREWDQKHLDRLIQKNVGGSEVHSNRTRRFSRVHPSRQQQQQQQSVEHQMAQRRGPPASSTSQESDPEPYYGFKAGAMYFRKRSDGTLMGVNSDNNRYQGTFPNQKIPMKDILDDPENNPLTQKCPENIVRYFHFPSNNMDWIQVRIADLSVTR